MIRRLRSIFERAFFSSFFISSKLKFDTCLFAVYKAFFKIQFLNEMEENQFTSISFCLYDFNLFITKTFYFAFLCTCKFLIYSVLVYSLLKMVYGLFYDCISYVFQKNIPSLLIKKYLKKIYAYILGINIKCNCRIQLLNKQFFQSSNFCKKKKRNKNKNCLKESFYLKYKGA